MIGISDAQGYLYDQRGLPIEQLFHRWLENRQVTRNFFNEVMISDRWGVSHAKFSTAPNDLLRESAFCLIRPRRFLITWISTKALAPR